MDRQPLTCTSVTGASGLREHGTGTPLRHASRPRASTRVMSLSSAGSGAARGYRTCAALTAL